MRDGLLGRKPKDIDLATSATPDDVQALFPKALGIGRAFGIMMLPFGPDEKLEIATFREDGEYRDGRRPEKIRFSGPEQDAKRRDFTVNALFFEPETEQVIDFVGGRGDLARKILRTVGSAETRFLEDQLRLLRAVRFVAQLNFSLEEETWRHVQALAPLVVRVAQERILEEIQKLVSGDFLGSALNPFVGSGLWGVLFQRWFGKQPGHFNAQNLSKELLSVRDPRSRLFILLRSSGLKLDENRKEMKLSHAWNHTLDLWFRWVEAVVKSATLVECLEFYRSEIYADFRGWLDTQDQNPRATLLINQFNAFDNLPKNFDEGLVRSEDIKALGIPPGLRMGQLLKEALEVQLALALREGHLPTKNDVLQRLSNT